VKLTRLAVLLALVLGLLGGGFVAADEALAEACVEHCDDAKKHDDGAPAEPEPLVQITGGTVTNETVIDITADGNTAIGDASGGDNNFAFASGADDEADVASAGNGGTATASANGGAVSVGNVNSGGNTGNAITVGNTSAHADDKKPVHDDKKPVCCDKKPAPKPGGEAPKKGGDRGGVKALPSTGTGVVAGESSALALRAVVGALGAAGYGLRRRFV
jgi:hypothetical protein